MTRYGLNNHFQQRAQIGGPPATLTDKELDAMVGLLAAVMNDDAGLETHGMSAQELAALRRGFSKLVRESKWRARCN